MDISLVFFVRMLIFGMISEGVKDMRYEKSGRQQHAKFRVRYGV